MRRLTGLLAAVVLVLSSALSVSSAPATMDAESQGWWHATALDIPHEVGHHVHVRVFNQPMDGVPIPRGPYTFNVRVTAHDQIGKITSIRVSDESTVKQTWPLSLGPCSDCSVDLALTVNFQNWGVGRHEIRWTANIPKNTEGNRQYQSTGWQTCVSSCSPNHGGRSANHTEARGWYDDGHDYANARLTSPVSSVLPGRSVSVKMAPGSGGSPTRFSGAYIDPDFHHHSSGIVLMERASSFSGSVSIPSNLSAGVHRLVLVSSDGKNAGVLAIAFTAP